MEHPSFFQASASWIHPPNSPSRELQPSLLGPPHLFLPSAGVSLANIHLLQLCVSSLWCMLGYGVKVCGMGPEPTSILNFEYGRIDFWETLFFFKVYFCMCACSIYCMYVYILV